MPCTKLYHTAIAVIAAAASLAVLPSTSASENFCGSTWVDAVSSCARDCPTGAPSDCSAGETCFAGTPCVKAQLQATPNPTPRPIFLTEQQTTNVNNNGEPGQWGNQNVANGSTATTAVGTGTCGDGQQGNGKCPIASECCSQFFYCGSSPAHCAPPPPTPYNGQASSQQQQPSTGGSAPSIYGTCGGGNTGNEICPNNSECCSGYGFCGITEDHCNNKNGNLGPNYPNNGAQQASSPNTPQFNQNGILVPAQAPQQQNQQTTQAYQPQQFGTCGSGQTGNGICQLNSQCCSSEGFCGNTLEHCTNKVGPSFPGQSAVPQSGNNMYGNQQQQGGGQNQAYDPAGASGQQFGNGRPIGGNTVQQLPNNPNSNQQFGNGRPIGGNTVQQLPNNPNSNGNQQNPKYPSAAPPHGTSKKIIGYYAGWQWYDRDKLADPTNLDFTKLNRVNYAFFQPDVLGNIYGTDSWGDPQLLFGPYTSKGKFGGGVQKCSYDGPKVVNCAYHELNAGLIHLAHAAGAEVYPSIGGWTLSDNFPTLSANPVSRDAFARNCVEILTHHDFDGIDIDWEYPGYAEHSGLPSDKENFTKMLAAIQAALGMLTRSTGKVYGLTAALPCNPDNIANIEVGKLTTILTEFNLMSYDFHGAWDDTTGMNAPLYDQGYGNSEFNIHRCVENYVTLGVPREKINIGLPFYGRSFKYASKLNQTHGGNDDANWPDDLGTPQYFNIFNKLSHMIQMRDNKSKTQYAYISHSEQTAGGPNDPDGLAQSMPEGLISFDDERAICDKVQYAQEKDLAGFIIWELSGDMLNDLQTPLLDITNRKLADPSIECCLLHSADECEKERLYEQQQLNAQTGGFDSAGWSPTAAMNGSGPQKRGKGGLRCSALVLPLSLAIIATALSTLFL